MMKQKRKMMHPNFLIGLISYLALLLGVVLYANGFVAGRIMVGISVLLGGAHWIKSIVDVSRNELLKKDRGTWYFWLALVIMIPPVAGMMYYMVKDRRVGF